MKTIKILWLVIIIVITASCEKDQLEDYNIIYHSGWVEGFRADIGYSPELGLGFAMLINAEANVINQVSSEFWAKAHELLPPKSQTTAP